MKKITSKKILIQEEIYKKLMKLKGPNESFSEVIERLIQNQGKTPLKHFDIGEEPEEEILDEFERILKKFLSAIPEPTIGAVKEGIVGKRIYAVIASLLSLAERAVIEMEAGEFEQLYEKGNEKEEKLIRILKYLLQFLIRDIDYLVYGI